MKTFAENPFFRSLTVKTGVFYHKPQPFSLFHFFPRNRNHTLFHLRKLFEHYRKKTARHLPSQPVKAKQKKRVFRALHRTLSFFLSKDK